MMFKRLLLLALFLPWVAQATCLIEEDLADANFSIGPFIDDTDFTTAETALTITSAEVLLKKSNGTAYSAKNDATACTHRSNGMYTCPLDATDTNTAGNIDILVAEPGTLIVRKTCMVVGTAFYGLIDGTTALLTSEQTGLDGDTTISTVNSTTEWVLTAGPTNDDAFNDMTFMVEGGTEKDEGAVCDYVGSTRTLTACDPPTFTVAVNDQIRIRTGASGRTATNVQSQTDRLVFSTAGQVDSNPQGMDAAVVDLIWNEFCEDQGSRTCREAMSILLSEAVGRCDYNPGTSTWTCNDPENTEARFTIVYGTDPGDRTSVTLTPMTP